MRLTIPRAAAVAVAVLAVAACGSQRAAPPATSQTTPSAAGQNGPAAFVARARQVTAQWDRSAAARVWRTGTARRPPGGPPGPAVRRHCPSRAAPLPGSAGVLEL
jgi:hypothetical protein